MASDQDLREMFMDAIAALLIILIFMPIKRILDQAVST